MMRNETVLRVLLNFINLKSKTVTLPISNSALAGDVITRFDFQSVLAVKISQVYSGRAAAYSLYLNLLNTNSERQFSGESFEL